MNPEESSIVPFAFPYAGVNRIRFQGVISGPLGPPLGSDRP